VIELNRKNLQADLVFTQDIDLNFKIKFTCIDENPFVNYFDYKTNTLNVKSFKTNSNLVYKIKNSN
jgi:hypothetical protein